MQQHKKAYVLEATFNGKCPACGEGNLFDGFLKIADTCNHCNTNLSTHDCGDGPIFFAMTVLCFTIVPLAVFVSLKYDVSIWVHLLIWPLFCVGGSLLLLRPLRGLFAGLKYRNLS